VGKVSKAFRSSLTGRLSSRIVSLTTYTSDEEIASFCTLNHGVTFPLAKKSDVNGSKTNPVFAYLKNEKSGLLGSRIAWNFSKFLVSRDGQVKGRYAPTTKPVSFLETPFAFNSLSSRFH